MFCDDAQRVLKIVQVQETKMSMKRDVMCNANLLTALSDKTNFHEKVTAMYIFLASDEYMAQVEAWHSYAMSLQLLPFSKAEENNRSAQ